MKETFNQRSKVLGGENIHGNWSPSKPVEKTYAGFGVFRGKDTAGRLNLYLKNGAKYSFSYALLPVISFMPPRRLVIKFTGYDVTIEGRGLQILDDYLSQENVNWIKEDPSGFDDPKEEVFIQSINVTEHE